MMVINGMITHVVDFYHIIAVYVNTVSISKQDISYMIANIHWFCHCNNLQDSLVLYHLHGMHTLSAITLHSFSKMSTFIDDIHACDFLCRRVHVILSSNKLHHATKQYLYFAKYAYLVASI
jgi:hypothetical protein